MVELVEFRRNENQVYNVFSVRKPCIPSRAELITIGGRSRIIIIYSMFNFSHFRK